MAPSYLLLRGVSRGDMAAKVLTMEATPTQGRLVPIPFTLIYDLASIQPNHIDSVSA